MKKILALLFYTLLGTAAIAADVPDISIADLKVAIAAQQVVVIDVNGSESYVTGHIPGALDFEAKEATLEQALPADKTTLIVAYCGGPRCRAYKKATAAAAKLGYTNIKHLSAGISGWVEAKEATEK
jgi:rhodanese-related sulfurtransferase